MSGFTQPMGFFLLLWEIVVQVLLILNTGVYPRLSVTGVLLKGSMESSFRLATSGESCCESFFKSFSN